MKFAEFKQRRTSPLRMSFLDKYFIRALILRVPVES